MRCSSDRIITTAGYADRQLRAVLKRDGQLRKP
jgi:hypothetical protein